MNTFIVKGGERFATVRARAQASNIRAKGVCENASLGKFGIFNSRTVVLIYCVRHTEKYTHLKNKGAPICPPMVV